MDWKSVIDEAFRNTPTIQTLSAANMPEALNKMAQMTVNAQKLVGVEKIPALKDGSSPEDIRAWRQKYLGVPESREGYGELKQFTNGVDEAGNPVVVEIPEAISKRAVDLAEELGLDKKQAARLAERLTIAETEGTSALAESQQAVIANNLARLREELGNNYQLAIDSANAALNNLGSPELVQKIAEHPLLANDSDFIKLFAGIGQQMMDDTARQGGRSAGIPTDPGAARARIDEIYRSEEWAAVSKGTASQSVQDHVSQQLDMLYRQAYPS
jgi:hypothetical protein